MRRGRSTGTPTKAQKARFEAIHNIGCLACWIWRSTVRCSEEEIPAAEVHHLTTGGRHGQRRRGHDYTIGLCQWHHRGVPHDLCPGETVTHAIGVWEYLLGPSYALEPRKFRDIFGDDEKLLKLQNELILERYQEFAA